MSGALLVQAVRSLTVGAYESMQVRRTYRAVVDSRTIRQCVIRCTLLNGVLLLGSVVLFEFLIRPVLSRLYDASSTSSSALEAALSLLYYVLWVFPWYVLSYIFNAGWYAKIAKRYYELRSGKSSAAAPPTSLSASASLSASMSRSTGLSSSMSNSQNLSASTTSSASNQSDSAWESILASLMDLQRNAAEAVYTIFLFLGLGIQCSLVGYLPLIGLPAQIVMFSWLSAFYCFDYRWRFGGFNIERRKTAFARDWAFFLGFGLPITVASHFLPFFVSYCLYAVAFPYFIITGIAAQRSNPDDGALGVPPIFTFPSYIASGIVFLLMRGRTSASQSVAAGPRESNKQ